MYNSYNLKVNTTSPVSSEIVEIISEFKKYLLLQKISSGSLRSYLSDVRHFLSWLLGFLENQGFTQIGENQILSFINEKIIDEYKKYLTGSNVPTKTINRRFSSLRKFGVFCQSKKWCSLLVFDTLKNIPVEEKPFPEDSYHLEEFRINLWQNKASKATIKNYLNDVKQFLAWTDSHACLPARQGFQADLHRSRDNRLAIRGNHRQEKS